MALGLGLDLDFLGLGLTLDSVKVWVTYTSTKALEEGEDWRKDFAGVSLEPLFEDWVRLTVAEGLEGVGSGWVGLDWVEP